MSNTDLPEKVATTNDIKQEEIDLMHRFYNYEIKEGKIKISIPRTEFIDLLLKMNYFRYNIQDSANAFIHINNGRVSVTNETAMIYAVEDYIRELPDREVEKKTQSGEEFKVEKYTIKPELIRKGLINGVQNLTGKNLDFLRSRSEFVFLKDTEKAKYLYFNNQVVEITPDGVNSLEYASISKLVWESSIIDFDFEYTEVSGEFEQFVENITGSDERRKNALMSALGYLMHDYYDYDLRAVFITDVNLDFESRAGGTGKGIIGKALMQMLNRRKQEDTTYIALNGSDFKGYDERRYSRAEINTQLIHIEDASKKLNPEDLVNDITDGAFIRKMHTDPFVKLLKIMVSTNFSIDFNSPTTRRRAFIFELTNYYSDKYRPSEDFKWFFGKDWTADDWNQFYSFMVRCCRIFITHGLCEIEDVNYRNRTLVENTDEDFVAWFSSQIEPYRLNEDEHEFTKPDLFNAFMLKYPGALVAHKKQQAKFTEWCKTYCRLKSIRYCEIRSTNDLFIIYPTPQTMTKSKQQRNKLSE